MKQSGLKSESHFHTPQVHQGHGYQQHLMPSSLLQPEKTIPLQLPVFFNLISHEGDPPGFEYILSATQTPLL